MSDIRTTMSAVDKADQRFWFAQLNTILGASIKLLTHKNILSNTSRNYMILRVIEL